MSEQNLPRQTKQVQIKDYPPKGYRCCCGKLADGGYYRPWLFPDAARSQLLALYIGQQYEACRAAGSETWTTEALGRVEAFKRTLATGATAAPQPAPAPVMISGRKVRVVSSAASISREGLPVDSGESVALRTTNDSTTRKAAPESTPAPAVSAADLSALGYDIRPQQTKAEGGSGGSRQTLHAAIEAYKTWVEEQEGFAPTTKAGYVGGANRLLSLFKNVPLAAWDYEAIERAINYLISAPPAKPAPNWSDAAKKANLGKPMSVQTILNSLQALRAFCQWLDGRKGFDWQTPYRFERLFKTRQKGGMIDKQAIRRNVKAKGGTVVSKHAEIEVFSVEELRRLYYCAPQWLRRVIVVSLNCGLTQLESHQINAETVKLDAEPPCVETEREKTGVPARWLLWAESVEALKESPVLTTWEGQGLAYYNDEGRRIDNIHKPWAKLCKIAKVRPLTFKFIRKTGADMIRSIADGETAKTYLAHGDVVAGDKIANRYTNRNFDRLFAALRTMREQLEPMFADAGDAPKFYYKPLPEDEKAKKAAFRARWQKRQQTEGGVARNGCIPVRA